MVLPTVWSRLQDGYTMESALDGDCMAITNPGAGQVIGRASEL
jgi:hypothetical protein